MSWEIKWSVQLQTPSDVDISRSQCGPCKPVHVRESAAVSTQYLQRCFQFSTYDNEIQSAKDPYLSHCPASNANPVTCFAFLQSTPTVLNFGVAASSSADAGPEAGPSTPMQHAAVKKEMPSAGTKMDPIDFDDLMDDLRGDRVGKPILLQFDSP